MGLQFSQQNLEESGEGALGTMAGKCQGRAAVLSAQRAALQPWRETGLNGGL